jgi:hypothetical protein
MERIVKERIDREWIDTANDGINWVASIFDTLHPTIIKEYFTTTAFLKYTSYYQINMTPDIIRIFKEVESSITDYIYPNPSVNLVSYIKFMVYIQDVSYEEFKKSKYY